MNRTLMNSDIPIKDKIHTIRRSQVILDSDLAELYQVTTKALNQAIKRNITRFPDRFMFRLNKSEYDSLRSQIVTLDKGRGTHKKYLPRVFTEQGVAMLSGILKSNIAINISIKIIDAFVEMRRFLSKNAEIFSRLQGIERKHIEYDEKFEKVFDAIEKKNFVKRQGIFYNGQIFDAHRFISDLIRSAEKSIILIDNYIDDSVLTLFTKRKKNVTVTIYTNNISKQLKLDIQKYNSQHEVITIKEFTESHDRFVILDNKNVYHIGASLKDLGKKWFAFSRFNRKAIEILRRLE